jgi:hypothetical protein
MSDFRYRNKNTGQVAEYDHVNHRLEHLDNWETLTVDGQDTPDAAKYQEDGSPVDQFGAPRSSLLLGKPEERTPPPPANVGPTSTPDTPPQDPDTPPPAAGGDDPQVPESDPEFAPLPPKSANKEAWVAIAMERGQMTREEAEAMTKPDLIDVFGEGDG